MSDQTTVVMYYLKPNRYSFNALAGAIETDNRLQAINLRFVTDKKALFQTLYGLMFDRHRVAIAISFFTTQLWQTHDLIADLRKEFGERILCIAGGPHPSADPLGTLNLGFDLVVKAEGEKTFVELLRRINTQQDYHDLKGTVVQTHNGCKVNPQQEPVDINLYPPISLKYGKYGPIEITRGCPFGCQFCQISSIFGTKVRHRTVDKICENVQKMRKAGLKDMRFVTPNAFSYGSNDGKKLNLDAVQKLLASLREVVGPHGRIFFGSFPSEVRPEHVCPETVELVKRYADNNNLVVGAQSGSDRILKLCRRGHTVEDIYRAVKLILKAGLKAYVDFIFGLPGETEQDIKQTVSTIKNLTQMGARIHTHAFIPLPQTGFAKQLPAQMPHEVVKMINKLSSTGRAFGRWRQQLEVAYKISKYVRTGKLE